MVSEFSKDILELYCLDVFLLNRFIQAYLKAI